MSKATYRRHLQLLLVSGAGGGGHRPPRQRTSGVRRDRLASAPEDRWHPRQGRNSYRLKQWMAGTRSPGLRSSKTVDPSSQAVCLRLAETPGWQSQQFNTWCRPLQSQGSGGLEAGRGNEAGRGRVLLTKLLVDARRCSSMLVSG